MVSSSASSVSLLSSQIITPPEALIARIADLVANRDRIFVGPEGLAVKEPRRLGALIAKDRARQGQRADVVVGPVAMHGMPDLEEAVVRARNRGPAVAIKGQAHEKLAGGNPLRLVARDAAFNTAGVPARKQRGQKSRGRVPRAGVVIVHHANLVDDPGHRREIGSRELLRRGSHRDGEAQPGTHRVHLRPEFLQQRAEILRVRGLRRLPVHIESVKDSRLPDPWRREVAADEHIHAGGHKRAAIFRLRIVRKVFGFAFERDQDLEPRVAGLQFLELVEIAAKRGSRGRPPGHSRCSRP